MDMTGSFGNQAFPISITIDPLSVTRFLSSGANFANQRM